MLTKSRRTLAASALALAAAGGGSAAVIRISSSPAPALVAPAALPSPAGPAATAGVPRGPGGADGSGSAAGLAPPAGQPDPGPAAPGGPASGTGAGPAAGADPADGAVPGASPAGTALAAQRAALTALPHSPQLLAELAGPAGAAVPGTSSPAAPAGTATAGPSATAPGPAGAGPAAPAMAVGPSGGAAPAAAHSLAGLDVAAFQHPGGQAINWAAASAAGYRFAAVKATEGNYYVSPWAAADLTRAKAAGLYVTPYHFAVPNAGGGAAQAQFAVRYSGYQAGARMLPLMLDIEYDPYTGTDHANQCYGLGPAAMTVWLSAFVGEARALTGQYPVIYTTADWWNTCTGRSAAFSADPMWVAAYGFTSPPMPAGWKSWTFWQYRSNGTLPGVNAAGATDVDWFSPKAVALINPGSQSTRARERTSLQLSSLGALAGESLTYTAAGLPPGVAVHPGGALSGLLAPSAARAGAVNYQVTVTAKNAAGGKTTISFTWQIRPA